MTSESRLILFCRSGYESELANECEYRLAENNSYGYATFDKGEGMVSFHTPSPALLPHISALAFARQKLTYLTTINFDDKKDRITPVIDALGAFDSVRYGNVIVEHADSEQAKTLAKFCKKFTVPLRAALRKGKNLSKAEDDKMPWLHLVFDSFDSCFLCTSAAGDRSPYSQGIRRLKFPPAAPSRSTLKLEEAIATFIDAEQESHLFNAKRTAVDLGACPGGWTYQLVSRSMKVEAVDNGDIAQSLMDTGLVKHFAADGFTYRPLSGKVDWLVCDMIENPYRVAELMTKWLQQGWAKATIFNLKLPMKQRFETVREILEDINKKLNANQNTMIQAKHLYHDRDEITVLVLPRANFY